MILKNRVPILVADDDVDDCQMIKEAFQESRLANNIHFVHDGEHLLDYLYHRGDYADKDKHPMPGLILLDLNMPKKDGREALEEIKSNERFKQIPIVVLTTSKAEEDIYRTYSIGVNSFISKPVSFTSFVEIVRGLGQYWFEIVELPTEKIKKS